MKRPFHTMACAAVAAHHAFELCAGVGLVFQHYIGLRPSIALWSGVFGLWWRTARRGGARSEPALAFCAGVGLGQALVHYLAWPWVRPGVPLLGEGTEGMPRRYMPAYNALLYAGMALSIAAIVREVPRRHRAWSAVGLLATFPLAIDARHHARWMIRQAWQNPAWWNRAFIETHARVEQEI